MNICAEIEIHNPIIDLTEEGHINLDIGQEKYNKLNKMFESLKKKKDRDDEEMFNDTDFIYISGYLSQWE